MEVEREPVNNPLYDPAVITGRALRTRDHTQPLPNDAPLPRPLSTWRDFGQYRIHFRITNVNEPFQPQDPQAHREILIQGLSSKSYGRRILLLPRSSTSIFNGVTGRPDDWWHPQTIIWRGYGVSVATAVRVLPVHSQLLRSVACSELFGDGTKLLLTDSQDPIPTVTDLGQDPPSRNDRIPKR